MSLRTTFSVALWFYSSRHSVQGVNYLTYIMMRINDDKPFHYTVLHVILLSLEELHLL